MDLKCTVVMFFESKRTLIIKGLWLHALPEIGTPLACINDVFEALKATKFKKYSNQHYYVSPPPFSEPF